MVGEETRQNLDEVIQWRESTMAAISSGVWVDPVAAATTLGNFIDHWRGTKSGDSGKTWATYNSLIARHFSTLAETRLALISTRAIRSWVSEIEKAGVGATTIRQAFRLPHQILEFAVADELLIRNPAPGIEVPKVSRKPRRALTI